MSTVTAVDGTLLRAYDLGDPDGTPVLLSNGLGSAPTAWPSLIRPGSGYRVVGWYHRGTLGSARPADPRRITVADHAADALAVADAHALQRPLVVSWSIGVNVAVELALQHPERVRGLLAVGGVPGGTFTTIGAPLGIPGPLRLPLGRAAAVGLRALGPALGLVARTVPVDRNTARLLAHSGFMLPGADPGELVAMLREFLDQDWSWYGRLALAAAAHGPLDTSGLDLPVHFLAGRSDVLTSAQAVVAAAGRIPGATVQVLPGSHFLPVERPAQVRAALDALAARASA